MGAVVDLFDDLRHLPVRPPHALRVYKRPEVRVISRRFIGAVEQTFQHRLPYLPAFVSSATRKSAAMSSLLGIFPKQIGAKA